MKEELQLQFKPYIEQYISKQSKHMKSHYTNLWEHLVINLQQKAVGQIENNLEHQQKMITESINIDHLNEIEEKFKRIIEGVL